MLIWFSSIKTEVFEVFLISENFPANMRVSILLGFGPIAVKPDGNRISAVMARPGRWRRGITAPAGGTAIDRGRTGLYW